jgi:hypothetical protein
MNLTAMLLLLGLRVGKNAENFDGNLDLEQCLIEAINYFTNFGETLIVPTSSNNLNLKKLSAFNKLMVLCTDHVEIRNENVLKIQRDVYIIEFGTYQELQTILNNMKIKKFWNLRSKFLLIFYGAQTEDTVEEIFKFSWQSHIYDLMLVLFRNSQTPNIFLWYPYFPTITKIDSCEFFKPLQKKLSLTEVPKMLIPRPLKVEVVIFPPYVISHDSGSDIRIVKELAAAMGTQASVNHSDIPFNFGIVLPDKTVSGMFGAAYYERVDMAIGGFILQPDKYALLDASYPYHNEFYYWCVPRAHKLPSWKQVFDTMNLETWILILLAYIVFTVVLWSLSSIRRQESFYNVITNCFFNIFAIFIGANVGVKPKSTFVRFFVLFWTMVCLILHIIYETKFISLMERGLEEKQIKTMEELLDSDLEIQMKSSSVILFGESPTLRRFVEQGYHQCKTVVSCIEKVAYSRNASVFASASFISYIKNLFIGEDNLPLFYCFDSGVDISPIFIGMRKGFPLKDYVDTILKRLVEGGFINFWRRQTFKSRKTKVCEHKRKMMTFAFFKAPLFCWIIGMSVAVCVFGLEIAMKKYTNVKFKNKTLVFTMVGSIKKKFT